jgi:hypothetical protein
MYVAYCQKDQKTECAGFNFPRRIAEIEEEHFSIFNE